MKLLFFDLETTGTNPGRNGIHQISGQVVIDGIVKEQFDFHVQPKQPLRMKPWRLRVLPVNKSRNIRRWVRYTVNLSQCLASTLISTIQRTSSFWLGTITPHLTINSCVDFSCRTTTSFLVHGFGQIQWMLWFLQPCILQASARKWRISNCQRLRQRLACKWMVIRCTMQCMTSN